MKVKKYWCVICAVFFACVLLVGVGFVVMYMSEEITYGAKEEREVLSFVVENHEDARPFQEGMQRAFLIQEFLVEGMISRFILYFDRKDLPQRIGPIRYFRSGIVPWSSALFHAGGSPDALEQALTFPTLYAFNGLGLPDHFFRDEYVSAPHNLYIRREHIEDLLNDKKLIVRNFSLFPVGGFPTGSGATTISVQFFNANHNVTYTYDAVGGAYVRQNGKVQQNKRPSNILILEMPIDDIGAYGRLAMTTVGSGPALLFRSGKVDKGRWRREGEHQPYHFFDASGEPLSFSAGQMWMMVLPTLERVDWNP